MISKKIKEIPPSGIRKFFDLAQSTSGIISLGVGEPDFVTPWHIREHGIYCLEKGYTMYTSNYGTMELRQEISKYLQKEYGLKYNPNNEILVTVGVSEGFDLAIRSILDDGDEVIIPEPCFVAYKPLVILAGGVPVIIETKQEHNFAIEISALERAITKKTKAIILSYPSNPTGTVLSKETLEKIAEISAKNNILIISDEIYHKLIYEGNHISFPTLPNMKNRTILLNGFSKTYAMTGWRIGFAAAPKEILEAMMKIHQYTIMCTSIISQKAAIEALKNGDAEVERMKEEYFTRRNFLMSRLKEIGISFAEPKGAFYIFPSIKKFKITSEEFCRRFLQEQKVAVVPGNAFGACGEGYIRISYAASINSIKEALNRFEKFIKKLK